MALNFNTDIAPLRAQFFPESGMRASDFRRMRANYAQNIAPLEERVINMQNNVLQMQAQDLAFKRAQIGWEKEKMDLDLRKQYNDPDALNRIGEMLETDKSPLEQREDILAFGRENPQLLQHNPAFATAYRTGLQQTETRAKIKDKEEAPKKAARASTANMLIQSKTPEGVDAGTRLYAGELTLDEGNMILKEIQAQDLRLAKSQKEVKEGKDRLARTFARLNRPQEVDVKDTAEYQEADATERQSLDAAFAKRGGKKYKNEYRVQLATDLMYYTDGHLDGRKITLEEALNLPDLELYKLTGAAARQQESYLRGEVKLGDTVLTPQEVEQGEAWNQGVIPQTTR